MKHRLRCGRQTFAYAGREDVARTVHGEAGRLLKREMSQVGLLLGLPFCTLTLLCKLLLTTCTGRIWQLYAIEARTGIR